MTEIERLKAEKRPMPEYKPADCDILLFDRWKGLLNHAAIVFIVDGQPVVYEAFPPRCHHVRWEDYAKGPVRNFVFSKANMRVLRHPDIEPSRRYLLLASCEGLEGTRYNWLINYRYKVERLVHCAEYIALGQIDAFGLDIYGGLEPSRITPTIFERVTRELGWLDLWGPADGRIIYTTLSPLRFAAD